MELSRYIYDYLGLDTEESNTFLQQVLLSFEKVGNVIDIATGYGSQIKYLLEKHPKSLTVVDNDKRCIEYIRKEYKDLVNAVSSDFINLDNSKKYDLVHLGDNSISMFGSYKELSICCRKIKNLMALDGVALINASFIKKDDILKYDGSLIRIKAQVIKGKFMEVYSKYRIDVFNNMIEMMFFLYIDNEEIERCKVHSRIFDEKEFSEILYMEGLKISNIYKYMDDSKESYYYAIKHNDN